GEKMSKSKGNLVLVSRQRAAGVDPMALRLVLRGQHYRRAWEWTDALLHQAQERLSRWRAAASVARAADAEPDAQDLDVVREVRRHLADDLDSPAALLAVDRWAAAVLEQGAGSLLVPTSVDALLGV